MLVIPAIDLRSRRVVRLRQGDFSKETFYSANPVETARAWEAKGAKLIHIVDLDGALAGEPKNLGVVEQIKGEVSVPIELGGGLRTEAIVERVFSKGIFRAIIGTRAYTDEEFLKRLLSRFKEKIAVSIDACGETVMAEGWTHPVAIRAIDLAKRLESLGVETIIYTNVLRDGTMEKPQLELIEEMLDAINLKVIVSGGISSLQDIKDIKALGKTSLYGVIIGKALYEGRLDLKEANKIAEGKR